MYYISQSHHYYTRRGGSTLVAELNLSWHKTVLCAWCASPQTEPSLNRQKLQFIVLKMTTSLTFMLIHGLIFLATGRTRLQSVQEKRDPMGDLWPMDLLSTTNTNKTQGLVKTCLLDDQKWNWVLWPIVQASQRSTQAPQPPFCDARIRGLGHEHIIAGSRNELRFNQY